MYLDLSTLVPSVEAMHHQYDKTLFTKIADCFTRAMNAGRVTTINPELREIENILRQTNGIDIDLALEDDEDENAYVIIPNLNVNHALLGLEYAELNEKAVAKFFRGIADKFVTSQVDNVTGKVTGQFTKLTFSVRLSTGLVNSGKYAPEEIAAVLCHEIGHIWTYCAWFKNTTMRNHVLVETITKFVGASDDVERMLILRQAEKEHKIKIKNKEYLSTNDDVSGATLVILDAVGKSYDSATGSAIYDARTWEAMSDQYVSRLGGGLYLARALDKINRKYNASNYRTSFWYMVTETVKAIGVILLNILLTVGTFGVWAFILLASLVSNIFVPKGDGSLFYDTYDRPGERIARIRNDLVDSLKNRNIASDVRKNILSDIAFLDKILSQVKDRFGLWTQIMLFLSSNRRQELSEIQQQQALEKIANNNLYVLGSKLETLV